jgi:hypothetical protein
MAPLSPKNGLIFSLFIELSIIYCGPTPFYPTPFYCGPTPFYPFKMSIAGFSAIQKCRYVGDINSFELLNINASIQIICARHV